MFRFRLSKHTQHASIYSEERQERRTRIRLPIPQAIFEKLFAPDWPGHVENEAEGPKTQKPNSCTRTTHTRNASAPSHDEFTSHLAAGGVAASWVPLAGAGGDGGGGATGAECEAGSGPDGRQAGRGSLGVSVGSWDWPCGRARGNNLAAGSLGPPVSNVEVGSDQNRVLMSFGMTLWLVYQIRIGLCLPVECVKMGVFFWLRVSFLDWIGFWIKIMIRK